LSRIYTSIDLGATWITNNVPNDNWLQVGVTADGDRLVAFLNDSMWGSTDNLPPHLNVSRAEGAIKLSWLVPSTNFVAEENLELDSANWFALTNAASVNFSNLNMELNVGPIEGNAHAFFRLAHH
jgi:hypothetical protein